MWSHPSPLLIIILQLGQRHQPSLIPTLSDLKDSTAASVVRSVVLPSFTIYLCRQDLQKKDFSAVSEYDFEFGNTCRE